MSRNQEYRGAGPFLPSGLKRCQCERRNIRSMPRAPDRGTILASCPRCENKLPREIRDINYTIAGSEAVVWNTFVNVIAVGLPLLDV